MPCYNSTILMIAAKVSFLHISWLVALIGITIVFFRDGLGLVKKSLLFDGLLFFFWLAYVLSCITFHRLSMRNEHNRFGYLAKDDFEKGKEVGKHGTCNKTLLAFLSDWYGELISRPTKSEERSP